MEVLYKRYQSAVRYSRMVDGYCPTEQDAIITARRMLVDDKLFKVVVVIGDTEYVIERDQV